MRKTRISYLFDTKTITTEHRCNTGGVSVDAAVKVWKNDRRRAADLFRAGTMVPQARVSVHQ
jgi:hypothetical protein